MASQLEDVFTDVKTNENGDGKTATQSTTLPFTEPGSAGQGFERLMELGLEPIAENSALEELSTEEGFDEQAPEYDEVSSEESAPELQLPETDQEESFPDAYFGSYDIDPSEARQEADEVVIGTDDRIRITNTSSYPWRVHCSLRIRTRTGKTYIGTGWFISPRTIMTAGHCVYLHNEGGWAQSITVMPGRNGSALPYGAHTATHFRSVTGWTNSRQRANDFGCIILPKNNRVGSRTGWLGFAYMGDSALKSKYVNLSGYPGDKPAGTQWYHGRRVKAVSSRTITYEIDTAGGQSGSAVYHIKSGKRYAVGIHTNGHSSGNSATRITKGVFNFMKTWKAMGS
ncbi:serine protease [Lewinella sp. JB7]|uniref:trypsin-like serine peptidase n=1 Tax=Lewinella sp. JB7 TaxID=2962887 RepID=UPI0020C9B198|nr:serine protease [Lewinella sp. JB7]MCP9234867.1 serine protease [Lewinella sp. JB7]